MSAAVALAHPIGPAPLYYIWPALTCGHYGTKSDARATLGLLCVTLALALAVAHDPQVPGIMYVSVVSIFALVADILREQCGAGDLVARMGGEEFAAVLFDTDRAAAQQMVDRIGEALAHWSRHAPTPVTTSAGIASLGSSAPTPSKMLVAADRALYVAKEAGRNRVVLFGEPAAHELARAA